MSPRSRKILLKNPLGGTGIEVSRIGLGAWPIGGGFYGEVSDQEGVAVVRRYLEMGGRFIDTARAYRKSERLVGRALASTPVPREEVVLSTKTLENDLHGIRDSLSESLEELRLDSVDILFLHAPPEDPAEMDEALEALRELKKEGRIRAAGASIAGPDVTAETPALCRQYIESGKVDVLQVIFSIARPANREVFALAHRCGVGIVARTVLENGFLTGKYEPGAQFAEGDQRNRWPKEKRDAIFRLVGELSRQGFPPPYRNMAEVAARFAVDEGGVSSCILGASRPEQANRNCEMDALPPLPYPFKNKLVRAFQKQEPLFNIE